MNASTAACRSRLTLQIGVMRIEIAAVVMLFTALAIVLITHAPQNDAHPPTVVASPPMPDSAMIVAGHGAATTVPVQRIAMPQGDPAGAPKP